MPNQIREPNAGEQKVLSVNTTANNWRTIRERAMELVKRANEEGHEVADTLTDGFHLMMQEYFEYINDREGLNYDFEPPRPLGSGIERKGFPRTPK